jgi:hypothetical protein
MVNALAMTTSLNRQSVSKRRHIKFRRWGIYPEENIQHTEHGESLKSRKVHVLLADLSTRMNQYE